MASRERALIAILLLGCAESPPVFTAEERAALATLRYDASPPEIDPSATRADEPAMQLFGQRLFFDPSMSGPLIEGDNDGGSATLGARGEAGRVSCAGCHVPATQFVDTRSPHHQVSLAAQWTLRRTPTLFEIALAPLYNWDGKRDSIWRQAIGVMESEREFNGGRLLVAEQVFRQHRAEYEAIFGPMPQLDQAATYPQLTPQEAGCVERTAAGGPIYDCRGREGDGADYDSMTPEAQHDVTLVTVNAAKAIEGYVRQLRCGESRFDAWLDGDESALTPSEQRGAQLFVGRAGCVRCHSGPNLTDGQFHNVGLSPAQVAVAILDADDRGAADGIAFALTDSLNTRGEFSDGDRGALPASVGPELEGAFRTPTLRCIADQPSYMHTAQLSSLASVMSFFARGGDRAGYPGTSEIAALDLSEADRADLALFIEALQGPGPDAVLLEEP